MSNLGRSLVTALVFTSALSAFAPAPAFAQRCGAGKGAQASMSPAKKIGRYVKIGALALAIAVPGMVGVSNYNRIVGEHQQVQASFSNIDVELQRRADLIPNLVAVVKGYAQHEQETFVKVAQARSALMGATTIDGKIAANQQLSMAMMPIIAMQERYPDLKANENFQALMKSLEQTENRISIERNRYNDAANAYNVTISTFPRNVVANMGSFKPAAYFQADSSAKQPVTIDLTHK